MSEIMTEINAPKKRMLSGIKPSGDLTLGSYLGAVKNWAERADEYDCFYFMADLHAITVRQNPADLRRRTLEQLHPDLHAQLLAHLLEQAGHFLEGDLHLAQIHQHHHGEIAGENSLADIENVYIAVCKKRTRKIMMIMIKE